MAFKGVQEWFDKRTAEYMRHVSSDVQSLAADCKTTGSQISMSEFEDLRLNSYEFKYLQPYFSDEVLVYVIENAVKNRGRKLGTWELPRHYDDYLLTDGIDELLKRFKAK